MRYDLKTPCKNCPFRTVKTAIRFATRGRAEEIEESAYRNGFPCHLSAEVVDDEDSPDGESGGFVAAEDTQHCAGYAILQLKESGGTPWPGIDNDEELADKLSCRLDWDAPVFDSVEDFFKASEKKKQRPGGERP